MSTSSIRLQNHIQCVIFDLDGTLYATPRHFKAKVALRLVPQLNLLRHLGAAREEIRQETFADRADLRRALFASLSLRSGSAPQVCETFYEEGFLRVFVELLTKREARPGLVHVLKQLRRAEIRLAVLSDYAAIPERLAALNIDRDLFDLLLSAEESGALKPSSRPFLEVARRLGIEAKDTLVVGDRADMDQLGAKHAGMTFLGVADRPRSTQPQWTQSATALTSLASQRIASPGPS